MRRVESLGGIRRHRANAVRRKDVGQLVGQPQKAAVRTG